jgi:TRAP-type C4-dicarboxylate transport system permease small subunit
MFEKLAGGLGRITGMLAALLLLCAVVSDALAIVFRYGIGQPLIWTEEVQRYLMVWVAFLGGAACLVRDEHMAVDLLAALLPGAARRILRVVFLGLTAVLCAVLVWKGIPLALGNGAQLSPAARIPMSLPYLAVGVGGALMLCVVTLRLCAELAAPETGKSAPP